MRHAAGLAADALHRALAGAAASGDKLTEPRSGRVLVAMSGGVDSATAALLEREAGREVIAVTLKLWADRATDGGRSCCSPEAVVSARALAHSLDLPHLTLDLEERFRAGVVDRFVAGYAAGQTPNPCVLCNGELRIEAMIELAGYLGADYLVTGHYARIADDDEGPLLAAAANSAKDQSYMLAALPPRLLERLRFPLAELSKPQVRELAARHGLPVARRAESQDLCFLAGQGKRAFLRRHGGIEDRDGEIVDRAGRRLGRHRGHHHFTVGQRRGLGVSGPRPLYVLGTDADSNTVTVGGEEELSSHRVGIRDAVLHRHGDRVDGVRLRYHSKALACEPPAVEAGTHERIELRLHEPARGVAPGQLATLLCGETIVGHGTIMGGRSW
jgi:tRNA-specific 2-thiouridylase